MDRLKGPDQKIHLLDSRDNIEKRKKFESQPAFVKAGLYYQSKFKSVRYQNFYQRFVVSELLIAKGNTELSIGKYREAARNFEQVVFLNFLGGLLSIY